MSPEEPSHETEAEAREAAHREALSRYQAATNILNREAEKAPDDPSMRSAEEIDKLEEAQQSALRELESFTEPGGRSDDEAQAAYEKMLAEGQKNPEGDGIKREELSADELALLERREAEAQTEP